MKFSLLEVAEAVKGDIIGPDLVVDGASIDSRSLSPGCLFVPVVADRDGHQFINSARSAGAAAYLCSDREFEPIEGDSLVMVANTTEALAELGRLARRRLPDPVIGVTGSVGKTSTKDLIAAACGAVRPTHANPASFNNELGLPLTLINAPESTAVTVLEMGARGSGHIEQLCGIGRPTIGVVTRVALAHGRQFGSIEGVEQAKGELIEALPPDGRAVLNAGDQRVAAMASRSAAPVLTYGIGTGDVAVHDLVLDEMLRPRFRLTTPAGQHELGLEARGSHMAENAAAAMATALAVGVDLATAAEGLATAKVSDWRMDVRRSETGAIIINDAYNANPTSVRAAVAGLVELGAERATAVLGVMAELGEDSDRLHREVADEIVGAGIRLVALNASAFGPQAEHVSSLEEAKTVLQDLDRRDAVLVKGSRVAGLEDFAEDLLG